MEDDGGHDDEHGALGVGVGEAQFGEPVHDEAEGDGEGGDEDEDEELHDRLQGLDELVDVDYLEGEEQQQVEEGQDEEEVNDGLDLHLETLLLFLAQVVPDHLGRLRALLAIDLALLGVLPAEEQFQVLQAGDAVFLEDFVPDLPGVKDNDGPPSAVLILVLMLRAELIEVLQLLLQLQLLLLLLLDL